MHKSKESQTKSSAPFFGTLHIKNGQKWDTPWLQDKSAMQGFLRRLSTFFMLFSTSVSAFDFVAAGLNYIGGGEFDKCSYCG